MEEEREARIRLYMEKFKREDEEAKRFQEEKELEAEAKLRYEQEKINKALEEENWMCLIEYIFRKVYSQNIFDKDEMYKAIKSIKLNESVAEMIKQINNIDSKFYENDYTLIYETNFVMSKVNKNIKIKNIKNSKYSLVESLLESIKYHIKNGYIPGIKEDKNIKLIVEKLEKYLNFALLKVI